MSEAVAAELAELGVSVDSSALAAAAAALAVGIDRCEAESALPAMARELREAMKVLRAEAKPVAKSRFDELKAKRDRRKANAA